MVPLKTSTTMLLLASQNVARPKIPIPSHSTTDCSLHRTGTSPRPIHFAQSSTQYTSLSRCLLLTRCQLSHLFHVLIATNSLQLLPQALKRSFDWPSTKMKVFWLTRLSIKGFLIVARPASTQTPQAPSLLYRNKNLDLSSLANPAVWLFTGRARTLLPDQDEKNCNHKNNNYFSSIHNKTPANF